MPLMVLYSCSVSGFFTGAMSLDYHIYIGNGPARSSVPRRRSRRGLARVSRARREVAAFPGVCPHDDVSLVDYGVLEGGHVRCRVHGYNFDLRTGRCEHQPQLHLRRYRVTISDGDVWVDLL